jgi:ABC-type dipeptide/oligopeptide/nickel transport system permease component
MRLLAESVGRIVATVLLGALLAATLVRYAPGFGVDEDQLDTRRSSENLERLRARNFQDSNVFQFYGRSLRSYLRGDFGTSRSLNRPIRDLIEERLAPTGIAIVTGLLAAWAVGLGAALIQLLRGVSVMNVPIELSSAVLQCVPAAATGLILAALGGRGPGWDGIAVGLVLVPRIYAYSSNLLLQANRSLHIVQARAKGLGQWRILLMHALPVCLPQLAAFAGISVSLALSAAIPMEVILDIPGIGQLAWQAALSRDMSLLVALSVLFAIVIVTSNTAAQWRRESEQSSGAL